LGALSDAVSITATLRRRKIAVNQKSAKNRSFLMNSGCFSLFYAKKCDIRIINMRIYLNGEMHQTEASSIRELIIELGIEGRMIAVERNLEVVPKSLYEDTPLAEDDRLEIVHMIGGG